MILDMHQDQYSRYIVPATKGTAPSGCTPSGGGDGARPGPCRATASPACAMFGIDELNPAESASFDNFWQNAHRRRAAGPGARHGTAGPLHRRAGRAGPRFQGNADRPRLRAHERAAARLDRLTPAENGYQASSQDLYPFYTRAIEALTGVRDGLPTCPATAPTSLTGACAYPQLASVHRQQIFFEPLAYRNLVDFSAAGVSALLDLSQPGLRPPRVHLRLHSGPGPLGYPAATAPSRRTTPSGTRPPRPRPRPCTPPSSSPSSVTRGAPRAPCWPTSSPAGGDADGRHALGVEGLLPSAQGSCWCVRWQRVETTGRRERQAQERQPAGHALEHGSADPRAGSGLDPRRFSPRRRASPRALRAPMSLRAGHAHVRHAGNCCGPQPAGAGGRGTDTVGLHPLDRPRRGAGEWRRCSTRCVDPHLTGAGWPT